jgi:hypothetical protein
MRVKRFFLSLLAIFLLIEEWLWDLLTVWGKNLARWLGLAKLQHVLEQASPRVALLAFLIPVIIVAPMGFVAVLLMAHGLIIQGILLEIVAKLLGTLLISQVFAWTKPQLMTFAWFAVVYTQITHWLHWAHEKIRRTWVYQFAQQLKVRLKQLTKQWWARFR